MGSLSRKIRSMLSRLVQEFCGKIESKKQDHRFLQLVNIPASLPQTYPAPPTTVLWRGSSPTPNVHPLALVKSTPGTKSKYYWMPSNLDAAGGILKVRKEESFKLAVVKQMQGSRGCIWQLSVYFLAFVVFCRPVIPFPLIFV